MVRPVRLERLNPGVSRRCLDAAVGAGLALRAVMPGAVTDTVCRATAAHSTPKTPADAQWRSTLQPFAQAMQVLELRHAKGETVPPKEIEALSRALVAADIDYEHLTPLMILDIDNTLEDWVHHITQALSAIENTIDAKLSQTIEQYRDLNGQNGAITDACLPDLRKRLAEDFKELPADLRPIVDDPAARRKAVHEMLATHFTALATADIVFPEFLSTMLNPTDTYYEALQQGIAAGEQALTAYPDVLTTLDIMSSAKDSRGLPRFRLAALGDGTRPGVLRRLDHVGARKFIAPDFILTRTDTGVFKPNPAGVLELMKRAGIKDPALVTVVGDGLRSDMRLDEQPELKGLKEIWARYGTPDPADEKLYEDYRRPGPSNPQPPPPPPQRTIDCFAQTLHVTDAEWTELWKQWVALRAQLAA